MRLTIDHERRALRRVIGVTQWAVPGTILALMPKCPMCLAAYIALWSGIGLSIPVASGLRAVLIAVSAVFLALLVIRWLRRRYKICRMCEPLTPSE